MLMRSWGVLALCLVLASACVLDRDGQLTDPTGGGGAGAIGGGGPSTGGMAGPGGGGGVENPPPGPVEELAAAVKEDVIVTWTNPSDADLQGVLVVHRPGQAVSFSPVDGTPYGVGQMPMVNHEVIFAGPGTMATLTPAVPGLRHHVAAWAFDDDFHYSPVRFADGLENALGEQVAEIEISLMAGTVTANVSPPNFPISGSALYNSAANEVTVELGLRNNTARVVHNLKALFGPLNDGMIANPTLLPPTGGTPFLYYGPQGMDVGASRTRTFTIANVDGSTDPITCTVTLRDDRWVIGQERLGQVRGEDSDLLLVDSSGSLREATISAVATDGAINFRGIAAANDGRKVYVGAKSKPFVTALDLVTFGTTSGVDLAAGNPGMVSGVALAPDGDTLYAALTIGAHHWGSDGVGSGDGLGAETGADAPTTTLALVALDAVTMMETQRVHIVTDDTERRLTRTMAVSHDGTRAAVIVRHPINSGIDAQIFFIDLTTFSLIDADPGTTPIDPVTIAAIRPDAVAWASDDNQLFVATDATIDTNDGALVVVNTTNFTQSDWPPASQLERTRALWVLGDVLYVAQSNVGVGVVGAPGSRFDTSSGVESAISTGLAEARGVTGFPGRAFFFSQNNMAVIDTTTHTRLDMDGDGSNGTTNIPLNGHFASHFVAITPF